MATRSRSSNAAGATAELSAHVHPIVGSRAGLHALVAHPRSLPRRRFARRRDRSPRCAALRESTAERFHHGRLFVLAGQRLGRVLRRARHGVLVRGQRSKARGRGRSVSSLRRARSRCGLGHRDVLGRADGRQRMVATPLALGLRLALAPRLCHCADKPRGRVWYNPLCRFRWRSLKAFTARASRGARRSSPPSCNAQPGPARPSAAVLAYPRAASRSGAGTTDESALSFSR